MVAHRLVALLAQVEDRETPVPESKRDGRIDDIALQGGDVKLMRAAEEITLTVWPSVDKGVVH
jgi:hypothetical protein